MTEKKPKVLFVEDDPTACKVVRLALGSQFQLVVATDGMSAIAAAQRERPDLILLDLGLPGGDGFLVMKRLKAIPRLASIPIVVLTGQSGEDVREKALGLGADRYLVKPIETDTFGALIREVLAA